MEEEGIFEKWSEKDWLVSYVRKLSRLLVGKSTENVWTEKSTPADWNNNKFGKWKNPTSSPKDGKPLLQKKFEYLKVKLPIAELPESLAFEINLFESGKLKELFSYKFLEHIYITNNEAVCKIKSETINMHCDSLPYLNMVKKVVSSCETLIQTIDENKASMSLIVSPLKRSKKAIEKVPNKRLKPSFHTEESLSFTPSEHKNVKKYQPILPKVTGNVSSSIGDHNIQYPMSPQTQINDTMSLQCTNNPQTKSQMEEHFGHERLPVAVQLFGLSFISNDQSKAVSTHQPVEQKVKSVLSLNQTEIENHLSNQLLCQEPEPEEPSSSTSQSENILLEQNIFSELSEKPDASTCVRTDWSVDSGLGNNCQSYPSTSILDQSVLSEMDPFDNLDLETNMESAIDFNNPDFMAALDSAFLSGYQ